MQVGEAATHAERPRRVFVSIREVPGLLSGTALGAPVACRRALGGRRGGRIGLGLSLLGLAAAAPTRRAALGALLLHVAAALVVGLGARRQTGHRTREVQRLALWTVLAPLAVAALARALGFGSGRLLFAAVLLGQVLLVRALRATRAA